ncbi:MAG: hydrogenase maturation nickel metallochaperone HypA [Rubrobacteridae bacterium]|nr:hydrogenase maturation nickel metallochaperone HypA [Rubrobacteridae bacterium]
MHEMGLTQSIIDIAVDHAERANANKITQINVKAGDFMSIVEDSLQFAFTYLSSDSIASGAQLVVERIPIIIHCDNCDSDSEVDKTDIHICPNCGECFVQLVSGREFYVDSIEVE